MRNQAPLPLPGAVAATLLMTVLSCFALLGWVAPAAGQQVAGDSLDERRVFLLEVEGAIGPATRDYLVRSLAEAAERNAELVVIRMDTPGGLDASTRDIIKDIIASPVPVATYVSPSGARAASAGTYILYASHIAAMSPATNVGAATPVSIMGGGPQAPTPAAPRQPAQQQPEGEPSSEENPPLSSDPASDPSRSKVVNDSVAYIRGLADMRGRNADWAEKAVRDADSITAEKALELGVIDLIAANIGELLDDIDGMTVEIAGRERVLETRGALTESIEPDWRSELLATITSPTIAYILLLIGVYGLILEGYNPGAFVPGVVGAISLLMALYAFQLLPVNYAGLGLILLGIILMIAEVLAPSFGVLGFGGIVAMVIGSIILIDTDVPGFMVSRTLIGSIAALAALGLMAIIWFALRARRRPVVSGKEELIGAQGTALESFRHEGHVNVHSERWNAISESPVKDAESIVVTGIDGLTLTVKPDRAQPDASGHEDHKEQ